MNEPKWVVKQAVPKSDYTIELEFADGKQGVFDASPLLEYPLFAPLKSRAFFQLARVDGGTVVWNDELDIAPEHLYEACAPIAQTV